MFVSGCISTPCFTGMRESSVAMTRITRCVEPGAENPARPTTKSPPKVKPGILSCGLLNDCGGPSQVRAVPLLLSHRHLFRFLSRCGLTVLSCNMRGKTSFIFNNTDTTNIVSDNCHRLRFYFLHVC